LNGQIEYKKAIASKLLCDEDKIFLYWKGRIALYAILKSLNLNHGDEVIIPAFTCVVVPNAILYAGLKPIYVDISAATYNMDVNLIEEKITPLTKVIICQNTFGLSTGIEDIVSIAKKYNLVTIEDCSHGFGGTYNGKPNGSHCDAAFFSTQWNKPFSTGIGGFSIINNEMIFRNLKNLEKNKTKPKFIERGLLRSLLLFRKTFINKYTQPALVNIYRFLSRYNLTVGSNSGEELNSTIMPVDYYKDISVVQIDAGIKGLKKIDELNAIRRKNAIEYTRFLKLKNKNHIDEDNFTNHMFLKYPLLVKDRDSFFEQAIKFNITLGDWFLSPLHPIKNDLERWGFVSTGYPIASMISKKVVNLPTDISDNSDVIKFLERELDLIE
jgi:dTDP-4-amino-4,6-dideoxygalactose transaminase